MIPTGSIIYIRTHSPDSSYFGKRGQIVSQSPNCYNVILDNEKGATIVGKGISVREEDSRFSTSPTFPTLAEFAQSLPTTEIRISSPKNLFGHATGKLTGKFLVTGSGWSSYVMVENGVIRSITTP